MKDEFYDEPNLEKLWEKCTFVFDTSVLMNLYTCPEETYSEFFSILKNEISNRIWIPYQISSDFKRDSVHGVEKAAQNYEDLKNSITILKNDSKNLAQKIADLNHAFLSSSNIDIQVKENFNGIDAILENMSESLRKPDHDEIRNKLNDLFKEKTGKNYPDPKLKEINNEAKIRRIKGIHPGFEENEYSNLISWYQMLDYAKGEKKDIIFVTENPGWWINPEKEQIEPHPSLIKEFSSIEQEFYIYRFMNFLSDSKKYLNLTDVIEELTDFSNKLKRRKSTKLENPPSDIALQEIIDNTLLSESALQKLINQSAAYKTLQKLIDQKVIDESDLQKMITKTIMSENTLQKLINQNTAYGTLQKLIDQKVIDESDLQKMITKTIMSENVLQKLIDQNTTTKNALEEALRKRTNN
ncbi:PIN-like domain-containing protein [Methanobacterium sp. MBAC-LM]|uniref:PIN-like domain-containing protein n=1 Tax=Methanobacterium sp. MBAC-LM TaxID=3412034 RepID=UPI003C782110